MGSVFKPTTARKSSGVSDDLPSLDCSPVLQKGNNNNTSNSFRFSCPRSAHNLYVIDVKIANAKPCLSLSALRPKKSAAGPNEARSWTHAHSSLPSFKKPPLFLLHHLYDRPALRHRYRLRWGSSQRTCRWLRGFTLGHNASTLTQSYSLMGPSIFPSEVVNVYVLLLSEYPACVPKANVGPFQKCAPLKRPHLPNRYTKAMSTTIRSSTVASVCPFLVFRMGMRVGIAKDERVAKDKKVRY